MGFRMWLPSSDSSLGGSAFILSYVDLLDLVREVLGAASRFSGKCIFDGWVDFGRYGRVLDIVARRAKEMFGWHAGPSRSCSKSWISARAEAEEELRRRPPRRDGTT